MKNIFKKTATLLLSLSMLAGVAACTQPETPGPGPDNPPIEQPTYEYALTHTSVSLKVGETQKIGVTVTPEKQVSPTYESENPSVATVATDGTITAVGAGTTNVKVTVDGKEFTCSVTVTEEEPEEPTYEYTLNYSEIKLEIETTKKLRVFVDPEKDITPVFESADANIATVADDGTITAIAVGTTTITATVDGQTLTCSVEVLPAPIVYDYAISQTEMELSIGATGELAVTVAPEKALIVNWISSNDEVASVSSTGVVTANGKGSATITAEVDDQTLTCEVTVSSVINSASATVTTATEVNLSDSDDTLDTLYWEHYRQDKTDYRRAATDYIVSSSIVSGRPFGDFPIGLTWSDGAEAVSYSNNTEGLHSEPGSTAPVEIVINVDTNVKAIRIFAGCWNATNTTSLWIGNAKIAEAESFTAGSTSEARVITFAIDVSEATTLTVKVTPSENGDNGNVSVPAVAILGTAAQASATVTMSKTEMTGAAESKVFLTEKGTTDWYYPNYEGNPDEKLNGTAIDTSSIIAEGNGKFWDYKASFFWSDGTVNATTPRDPGDHEAFHDGTNNGICGAYLVADVTVNANTDFVYFWVGGYDSNYYVKILDANGIVVLDEFVAARVDGQSVANELKFAIDVESEQKLTFIVYRTTGNNCSIAAIAVHEPITYTYTLDKTAIEVSETQIDHLNVSVAPERWFTATYESENPAIATVDQTGAVTGVAIGETKINVIVDGAIVATCNVTVTAKPIEYVYNLSSNEENLLLGATTTLTVTVAPEKAISVEWISSDPSVVTVENGVVKTVGGGKATITAKVDGKELICDVTVTVGDVVVTSMTAVSGANQSVYLTDASETLDTLYWEHYMEQGVDCMMNAEDLIPTDIPALFPSNFYDYAVKMGWDNGTNITSWGISNTSGKHSAMGLAQTIDVAINVNPNVKEIRAYVGAWRATNTVSLWLDGNQITESTTFTAGDSSEARIVTFNVNVTKATTVTLRMVASDCAGNVSLPAIVILGENTAAKNTTITSMTKTEMTGYDNHNIFLTEYGTQDWFYANYDHVSDRKAGGSGIHVDSFKSERGNKGWDYRAAFAWSDGTTFPTSPIDNDCNNQGTNNFVDGTFVNIDVTLTPEINHVYLWVTGWNSDYSVMVVNSNGTVIYEEQIATRIENQNQAYQLDFTVNVTAEERVTFIMLGRNNAGIAAVALHKDIEYTYTLSETDMELAEEEIRDLTVSVSPDKRFTATFKSNNEEIATVSNTGRITALKEGNTTITVTVDGKELICNLTVVAKPIEYVYTLSANEATLTPNKTVQLTVNVTPIKEDLAIEWISSDANVAKVENGLVTAIGAGNATITAKVDGKELICDITVTVDVTAGAVTVEDGAGQSIDLNDCDETLDTLYWEHYQSQGTDKKMNVEDLILSNDIEGGTWGFGDYKASLTWRNSSNITSWGNNTNGLCYNGEGALIEVKVNPNVKAIRIYTGAWKATGSIELYWSDTLIATSDTYTAGDNGIARFVTFNIDVKKETTVVLKILPSNLDGGNNSLVAIAVLGNATATSTTSVTMNKTELTGPDNSHVNLTEKGTTDWFYLNFDHVSDRKAGGSAIDTSSLKVESGAKFWDFKAAFNWTDGTTFEESPIDNDCNNQGTNNGMCGAFATINVNVTEATQHVYLYASGWISSFCVQVVDSNGNIIYDGQLHERVDGQTFAYEIDFAVVATKAETLSFIVYITEGNNCGLAAVAVA